MRDKSTAYVINFREEIIANTLFVTPIEGANRVERVAGVDRGRKPADSFDRAGRDSFAEYFARAKEEKQKVQPEDSGKHTEVLTHMNGMSYYNRHAMTAYFSMAASKTNFTC